MSTVEIRLVGPTGAVQELCSQLDEVADITWWADRNIGNGNSPIAALYGSANVETGEAPRDGG